MTAQVAPAGSAMGPHIYSWRVDPTGHVVPEEVPNSFLQRWQDDRAAFQAALAEAEARYVADLVARQARIGTYVGLVNDAFMVANDLRGLVYLFEKAVVDDGPESPLTTASHIVIDCIRSMATRLENLEARAAAARGDGGSA